MREEMNFIARAITTRVIPKITRKISVMKEPLSKLEERFFQIPIARLIVPMKRKMITIILVIDIGGILFRGRRSQTRRCRAG
jgi:hypothetical protein